MNTGFSVVSVNGFAQHLRPGPNAQPYSFYATSAEGCPRSRA